MHVQYFENSFCGIRVLFVVFSLSLVGSLSIFSQKEENLLRTKINLSRG